MKKKIKLSISKSARILVKEGDVVSVGTKLAEEDIINNEETLNLSLIFSASPKQTAKYLKVNIGQKVKTGDILAVKKSIFSSITIKSPMNGIIKGIDLNNGSINLGEERITNESAVISNISGKIEKIEDDSIEISIIGEVIAVEDGKGEDVSAQVVLMNKDILGVSDNIPDINEKILVCRSIEKDTEIKLEVLGVKGFAVLNDLVYTNIPWVRLKKEDYENMLEKENIHIWLRPKERELIIFH